MVNLCMYEISKFYSLLVGVLFSQAVLSVQNVDFNQAANVALAGAQRAGQEIARINGEIEKLDQEIASATDPQKKSELEEEKQRLIKEELMPQLAQQQASQQAAGHNHQGGQTASQGGEQGTPMGGQPPQQQQGQDKKQEGGESQPQNENQPKFPQTKPLESAKVPEPPKEPDLLGESLKQQLANLSKAREESAKTPTQATTVQRGELPTFPDSNRAQVVDLAKAFQQAKKTENSSASTSSSVKSNIPESLVEKLQDTSIERE